MSPYHAMLGLTLLLVGTLATPQAEDSPSATGSLSAALETIRVTKTVVVTVTPSSDMTTLPPLTSYAEESPSATGSLSATLRTVRLTKTVVVTVTPSSDTTTLPPPNSSLLPSTASYTSAFATPPPPDAVPLSPSEPESPSLLSTQSQTLPTLACPSPVPQLASDPLPTPASSSTQLSPQSAASSTVATSGHAPDVSTNTMAAQSMSQFVFPKPTAGPVSGSSVPMNSEVEAAILPITPQPVPSPTQPPAIETITIDETSTTYKTVYSTVYVKLSAVQTSDYDSSTGKNFATSAFKTDVLNPLAWAGMDGAIKPTQIRRSEESKGKKRRSWVWPQFFAAALPLTLRDNDRQCVPCDRDGEITCLDHVQYAICQTHCIVTKDLGRGVSCSNGTLGKMG